MIGEGIRHESFLVTRSGSNVRVEIDGHYVDLLPEMAIDVAEHMKRLVGFITSDEA